MAFAQSGCEEVSMILVLPSFLTSWFLLFQFGRRILSQQRSTDLFAVEIVKEI